MANIWLQLYEKLFPSEARQLKQPAWWFFISTVCISVRLFIRISSKCISFKKKTVSKIKS